MMRKPYVLGALCAVCFVSAVHAERGPWSAAASGPTTVTIEVRNSGGIIEVIEVLDSGEAWTHTITSSTGRINILPSSSTANIGRLTFQGGTNNQDVDVILGSGTALGAGANPNDVGNDWGGLNATGQSANFRLYGGIGGDLTDSILVDQLDRFDAGGEIQALVQADDAFSVFFLVFADSVSTLGSIDCVNGTIDEVNITNDCSGAIEAEDTINVIEVGGDLLFNVTAGNRIGNITVTGTIGSATRNAEITTTNHVGAYHKPGGGANAHAIESITAATMYADITTPSTASVRGDIGTITTNGTVGATAGDFYGSITTFAIQDEATATILDIAGDLYADIQTNTIKRPIRIDGDLKAGATITMTTSSKAQGDIEITGALAGTIDFPGLGTNPFYDADIVVGSISSTGKILVKDDMTGSIICAGIMAGLINIDGNLDKDDTLGGVLGIDIDTTAGLTGQIIINSADNGGLWTDDVVVGAITLDPRGAYTQIGLGGGAVGLVGFDLHL